MFIAILFKRVKNKNSLNVSSDKWINKMLYIIWQ